MTAGAALRAEALAARLPPLVVAADRVAATVLQGVHGRRRAGQGDAFWQFRPFLPGDQVARVDWRQSAKSDRLFIRETEWEAAQTVCLWSDASRSMEHVFARGRPTKRERADLLVSALASLVLRGGERVRLIGGASGAVRRSHAGRAGLAAVVESLAAIGKSGALPMPDPSLPRHARVVLVGDFLAPLEEIHAAVAALAGWRCAGTCCRSSTRTRRRSGPRTAPSPAGSASNGAATRRFWCRGWNRCGRNTSRAWPGTALALPASPPRRAGRC